MMNEIMLETEPAIIAEDTVPLIVAGLLLL